ncbi:MAG: hypothetical protein OQJ83_00090, partial [Altibacter sp.]|nr:hypothetical protein [Altibacter sp.]
MMQQQLFSQISLQLEASTSLIDIVAMVLDISYDAAHRRTSMKAKLSLEESVLLARHFSISLDQMYTEQDPERVIVNKTASITSEAELHHYFESSYRSLAPLVAQTHSSITYSAKDIPLFYTLTGTLLAKFKIYVWLKLLHPRYSDIPFEAFHPGLDLLSSAKRLGTLYESVATTEIWDTTTINSTLKQIHFYHEAGLLSAADAKQVCWELRELLKKLHRKVADAKPGFTLYFNELLLMNNNVLVTTPKEKMLYVPFTILSYFRTSDVLF